jgi:hypothetical protein
MIIMRVVMMMINDVDVDVVIRLHQCEQIRSCMVVASDEGRNL